jgi:FkbM family methyltransferase
MSLLSGFRNRLGYMKRVQAYGSAETAQLIQDNLATIVAPLRPENGKIRCDALDLTLDPKNHGFYLKGLPHVQNLHRAKAGRFITTGDGAMEYQNGSVRIVPETAEELLIIDEIFAGGSYDLAGKGDWLAWDVGTNVGIAAAYFGGIKGWETVGFEPFPEPWGAARANIERSGLSERVEIRPVGILDRDATLRLPFNHEYRGRNGLYGNSEIRNETTEIEVTFVDADAVVAELEARAQGRRIFAKIDCEGSEYSIVRRLKETGRLRSLDAIIMEYHLLAPEHDYEGLVRDLTEAGFLAHGQRLSDQVGMIYAVRTDRS